MGNIFRKLYRHEDFYPSWLIGIWINPAFIIRRGLLNGVKSISSKFIGGKLLDVGCGSGRYSLDLAKKGMVVTCVDLSQEMLNIAKTNSHKAGFFNNTYIAGSYIDVEICKKHDASILMGLFDYISNPEELFSKLMKDTSKYILASFPKPCGILGWQRKIRYNMRNCQLFYYTKESLQEFMRVSDIINYEIQD